MSSDPIDHPEKQHTHVHIRWMIHRDMPDILQIEKECFEYPWSEDNFLQHLRERNRIGMVAEQEEKIVGFMVYELHKTKLHVLNFAVQASSQRCSVGTQMANKLISKLSSRRRRRITLNVRETNLAAQIFFRSQGFQATCVVRDFYEDSEEDAYRMQYCFVEDGGVGDVGENGNGPVNRIAQYEEN